MRACLLLLLAASGVLACVGVRTLQAPESTITFSHTSECRHAPLPCDLAENLPAGFSDQDIPRIPVYRKADRAVETRVCSLTIRVPILSADTRERFHLFGWYGIVCLGVRTASAHEAPSSS